MPTLNTKLFLRMIVASLVLIGGVIALHTVQAGRVPDALLWQANTAAENGKTDKAIFYMQQYLVLRPDDHDTAVRLGDMMVERAGSRKDYTNAHFLYERILREAPHRTDVARKLVALSIRLGRYGDAVTHAERLLRENPNDGELLTQVAECQVAQNRHDEARKSFEKAVVHSPENVRAFDLYARLLTQHFNRPEESQQLLDRMVAANPGRSDAYLVRARFLRTADRPDECMKDLDQVLLVDPENGEALVMSAEILQARGELRRAREALRAAVALYPRYVHGYRALSWLELLYGNQADALATLERGAANVPNHPELLTPLADLWVEQGELDRVEATIKKLEERKESAARARYLRGRVLMKQAKWNEALNVLETLRSDTIALRALAPQLNLLIASCHERRGDRDAQIEALHRALAADPKHLASRVALANAHLNAGRFADATKEYQTAAASPYAGMGVQLTLVNLRIAQARYHRASSDEWKAIESHLNRVRQQNKSAFEPVALMAELLAAQGKFSEAAKWLRDEAAHHPGDPRRWSALASMLGRTQGTLAAIAVIGEGQLATGDSIELRLARARVWADDIQPGRADRLATLEDISILAGDADCERLGRGLAELYEAIDDESGQQRVLTKLAERNSGDLATQRDLLWLAYRTGNESAVNRWKGEVRRLEGSASQSAAVLEALHLVEKAGAKDDRLATWQGLARQVLATSPDDADAHLLVGRLAAIRGESATASRHFDLATALDPASLRCQRTRLQNALRIADDEYLSRLFRQLQADPRITSAKLRAIVTGAIPNGGPEALSKCLAALTGHLQREPRSAVWAGRLLEERGKITDAIALYQMTNEKHPIFVDAWSARLVAAARLGEGELRGVTELAANALDRKTFLSVCAECGALIRAQLPQWAPPIQTADDRRVYAEACITVCEARGQLTDAIAVLNAIAKDTGSRPNDVEWARRSLAALSAALGSPDKRSDAIAQLRSGTSKPASIEESRARVAALMIAFRTVSGNDRRVVIRELIALLNQIVRDPAATSNEWFQLAQLHRVAGDRKSCRQCLVELTRREPENLFYLAINVDDLLASNRLDVARALIPRLDEGFADIRVAAAAGRFHTLAGEPSNALKVMDAFVRVADPGTTDGIARQRQAAEVLDRLTRLAMQRGLSGSATLLEGACERYRASLQRYPEAVASMAALLGFCGRVDQAFEQLERHQGKLSRTTLATAGVAVLRSGHASPAQFELVKGWIDVGLASDSSSMALKLNLGELHALQQDFGSAEVVYRDVLKRDPKNLVAMNNLAWILAPRTEAADQAMQFADRAIALYGANAEILDTRARILISAGKYDRAVADLTDAINQRATPLRVFHLALAQWKMNEQEQALQTFRAARRRGLDSKNIHPHDLPTFKILSERTPQ